MLEASCLCGAVRVRIRRVSGPFEFCHCPRCRKATGSAFAAGLGVARHDLEFLAGAENVRVYEAPILKRPPAYRAVSCQTCGSPVPDPRAAGDLVEVPAGLLDGDPGLRPERHIMIEHRTAWFPLHDELPRFTRDELDIFRAGARTASAPALLVLVGASGAGKTAAVEALAARSLPGLASLSLDSLGVPSIAEMESFEGGAEGWQAHATERWLRSARDATPGVAVRVLEGQTRISTVRALWSQLEVGRGELVLLDCASDTRRARLEGPRGQPELANAQMDCWAAYLRGQADALGLRVIDTTTMTLDEVVEALIERVEVLRGGMY